MRRFRQNDAERTAYGWSEIQIMQIDGRRWETKARYAWLRENSDDDRKNDNVDVKIASRNETNDAFEQKVENPER